MKSDDHPVRILYPDYKPAYASEMAEYLHKLADGELEQGGEVPGKNEPYPDPGEGQDKHDLKREDPIARNRLGHEDAFHSSDRVFQESSQVRRGVLDRTFEQFAPQSGNERAMMAANFEHVRSGQFESHSALLQPKEKTSSLAERVRKLIG
jgi:hypothetical protein